MSQNAPCEIGHSQHVSHVLVASVSEASGRGHLTQQDDKQEVEQVV